MTQMVMVHGRFQPFHKEHLSYVLEGLAQSGDGIMVGVTNPFPTALPEVGTEGDSHRHHLDSNPYSFVDRARMIQLSLAEEGVGPGQAIVIPMHLESLDQLRGLTGQVRQLVNVLDRWDEEKCRRFSASGFAVETFHRPRTISASQVRERLRHGKSVETLVPRGTLTVLESSMLGDPGQ